MNYKDVLIIGAGAAGSSAAFHLAKAGFDVALLEKDANSIVKSCGGGMAAAVQEWFPFDLKPAVDQVIDKVEFTWCLDDRVIAELPGSAPFWIVRRENLDDLIANKAVNAGAELIKPFLVKDISKNNNIWQVTDDNGKTIKARAVVLADGSLSKWPQFFKLGPPSLHYASTTSVRLTNQGHIPKGTAKFEFGLVNHGFAWAFPLENGVNVGIGSFIGNNTLNSEKVLEKLLPNIGFDPKEGSRTNKLLRVWNGHHNLHGEGIIAIGDAASLCDPFLAEGLRPALMSGCEGAKNLSQWLKGDSTSLHNYSQAMRTRWGNSMAWGRRIAQVFYRFPKVGYQLGVKRPTAPQRIAQILSGEMGYGDIAQRVIKRLLLKK